MLTTSLTENRALSPNLLPSFRSRGSAIDSAPAFGASASMPRDQSSGFLFDFSAKASCFVTLSELSSVLLVAEAALEAGGVCPSSPPVDAPSWESRIPPAVDQGVGCCCSVSYGTVAPESDNIQSVKT